MAQPYRGKLVAFIGCDAVLKRPHLSAYIAAITTEWERVDEMWGVILARALGSSGNVGIEIFHSVTGSAAQSAILKTGIRRAILHDHVLLERFDLLLKDTESGPASATASFTPCGATSKRETMSWSLPKADGLLVPTPTLTTCGGRRRKTEADLLSSRCL